jgi:ABC-2 type transport system ATP-binding protein
MIDVKDLVKWYGPTRAIDGLNFQIPAGQIVGFLGPNGAGKSTTLRILTGFLPPTSGQAKVDGHDVLTDSMAVRRKIGYLPESNPLYRDMLVYDYLRYVASVRGVANRDVDDRIKTVAQMCGIVDRLAQEIATLSKGYKQRVGLAQALIHDPDILILDEPTSGLDPNQIVEIRNLIKALGRERTIILSTHNLPEVMATCNRMLIVHNGQLVADGTPAALQAKEEKNLRVAVVLAGAEEAAAKAALGKLADVTSVTATPSVVEGAVSFEVVAPQGSDLRRAIFKLAVDEGWELVELHRQVLDLEGIFRKLTQEV